MENKKIGIKPIVIGCCIVIVVAALLFAFFGLRRNYKSVINDFAKAVESEEKMEKFAKKNIDFKAVYALQQVSEDEDIDMDDEDEVEKAFKKEYKKAKKSDYKDLEEKLIDSLDEMVVDEKLRVKKIGGLKDYKHLSLFKSSEVTFERDGEESKLTFVFYKNKIVTFDYEYDTIQMESDISDRSPETIKDANVSMTQQAKDAYNNYFTPYIGEDLSANEVKALIQSIILSNQQYIDLEGKFVSLEIDGELAGETDFSNLDDACENASDNNNDENISNATQQMSKVKVQIDSSKKYDVTADYRKGIIVKIIIKEK